MIQQNQDVLRVLYLYAGSRRVFYQKWQKGLVPDTQLLGLNHLNDQGIDATFLEWPLCEWLRKIHFNLVHLPYIFAIKKYDVVFICAGLPLVFLAKCLLGWHRPKFVIYNTSLTNALKRNPTGFSNYIVRKAIGSIDMIVCTAQTQQQFLIDYGFNPDKITCAPIGIDASRFVGEQLAPTAPSVPYILSVGRDLGRDYRTLFEAVRHISSKVIVATKREAISGLAIPENVEVLFNVPYEAMPALYKNAQCVVTPLYKTDNSHGSDTSGQYGYLEPMSAGKAVIVANRDAVRDYITDNQDGLLYEPENPIDLAQKIETALADTSLRERLGKNAQEKVLAKFTSKQFAKTLATIFQSLLG